MSILLIEITGYNPDTAATEVVRLTTATEYRTGPAETPANATYLPAVAEPYNFERNLYSNGKTSGRSKAGAGVIKVNNPDGAFDYLLPFGFDGQPFQILSGEEGAAYDDFTVVATGTIQQAEFEWDTITFRVRDRQEELNVPIQATKYAGTNSGATGVEGTADDLKGKPKPLCYGPCLNVTPAAANTVSLIFQVHDGPINAVSAVYDNGAALTADGDQANLAALQAASISAGHFATCLSLGLFRLGSSPAGQVTADVQGDKTGGTYASTVADIVKCIVKDRGGLTDADLSLSTFTALNTANSAPVDIYIADDADIPEILDRLCNSIGAFWTFNRSGLLQVGRFVAPTGSPVATFTAVEILEIQKLALNDDGKGVPAWRITLDHSRNWTKQDSKGLAGSVTDSRRAWLAEDVRTVKSEDATIKTAHLLAQEMSFETLLTSASDAQTEADRLLAIYKVRRDRFKVTLPKEKGIGVDLGSVVNLTLARFGLDSGKLFSVIGMVEHYGENLVELDLYG